MPGYQAKYINGEKLPPGTSSRSDNSEVAHNPPAVRAREL